MNDIIKFIPDSEILNNGLVPLSLIILIVVLILIITVIFVKNEIKGVKK